MLDKDFFEYTTDGQGQKHPILRIKVPLRLLRIMGLLTGEAAGRDEDLRETQIPVRIMRAVRERCRYSADFGKVEENSQFFDSVQLMTIPCRSSAGDGCCTRTGEERSCTLFGVFSSVDTPEQERVNIIVAPIFPGAELSSSERELLAKKVEIYHKSLRQIEALFVPVTMLMDAANRSMQFWLRSWFGK
ncbi:MAG: hypothetical protein H7839_05195 [Magnetococcus sp. YQC-5]